jgi:hypothetical protein
MMAKKLPKTIYVKWHDAGDGELYLQADEEWDTHGELHEKHVVGTYQLVETSLVVSETKKLATRR